MTKSETTSALTTDDITKLKAGKMGNGCLWVVAVPAILIFLFFLIGTNWDSVYWKNSLPRLAVAAIPFLLLIPVYLLIKNTNDKINADIISGKKKIIVAPITDKRIKSSEITRGREKGGISSEYFMTVAGTEYPMTEHKYLLIPVGEFMEIHLAQTSNIVLQERWLKQNETSEEGKNELEQQENIKD